MYLKNLITRLCLLASLIPASCKAQTPPKFNLDMEEVITAKPRGWNFTTTAYYFKPDSVVKQQGKYSLAISKGEGTAQFGAAIYKIPKTYEGKTIVLKGFMKTDKVNTGYVGLMLRIDGNGQSIAFDNMADKQIKGTTDWTEYTIEVPYKQDEAASINVGGILVGDGTLWVDNLRLFIDGKPIEQAKEYVRPLNGIEKDSVFAKGSKIDTIIINPKQTTYLTLLGQLWGFLKYHHPAIAKAEVNWDAELFRILPQVQKATTDAQVAAAFEKWVDKLGKPAACHNCALLDTVKDVKIKPDYGQLFSNKVFSNSLTAKLRYILANRNTGPNYYVGTAPGIGNPDFTKEDPYIWFTYPDAGYRMLSLFRYWNMIQYFFPYKHLIGEDWNKILPEFIPRFAQAGNMVEHDLAVLQLIARIHDTHANVWSNQPGLTEYRGSYYAPFRAKFIEGKLTVTGFYEAYPDVKSKLKPGDVITKVNGIAVDELVKKYLPLTAASNYETQLRDMPRYYLLRGKTVDFNFEVEGKPVAITGINMKDMQYKPDDPSAGKPGYYLLPDSIAYLLPSKYKNADLPAIKHLFKNTKGMIIDMRCYPSEFMPFTFGSYIKSMVSAFVRFTACDPAFPGLFALGQPLSNGLPDGERYNGKIVIIVNEETQSQAEYTTMAFQSAPHVTVIGSTTAGADGNVSRINLPGNVYTMISGLGVYYPDGTETQRVGVKIDVLVKPTIKGVKEGRDELLEKAVDMLKN